MDSTHDCCVHPFSDITYSFTMKRKHLYYVMYLIVPCLLIAMLVLLNFVIPADSGERIGFCITILLAMSVYLLLVAESLPKTSNKIPLIGLYYIITMIEIALALAATVLTPRCHHGNGKPPAWLICLTTGRRRKEGKVTGHDEPRDKEEGEPSEKGRSGGGEVLAAVSTLVQQQNEESTARDQWNDISRALDKFFLFFFSFLSLILALSILVFTRA